MLALLCNVTSCWPELTGSVVHSGIEGVRAVFSVAGTFMSLDYARRGELLDARRHGGAERTSRGKLQTPRVRQL